MSGRIILDLPNPSLTADGAVDSGATLTYYMNGTTTLQSIYADAALLTPLANPLNCDAAGRFPIVWAADGTLFSVLWSQSAEAPITFDDIAPTSPISPPTTLTSFATISALKAGTAQTQFPYVSVDALTVAGNTGKAFYSWNGSSSATPDDVYLVRPTGLLTGNYILSGFADAFIHSDVTIGDGTPYAALGDIGAQANLAYAALPAKGGKIVINAKSGGGKYDFSTPVVFTTFGKYALLAGSAPGGADSAEGVCLNYVPTTATAAFTFDYASVVIGPPSPICGMRDITLVNNDSNVSGGASSLATGILVGTTNGGDWDATYINVHIQGFGMGYSCLNGTAVDQTWINPVFLCNDACFTMGNGTQRIIAGQFAANGRIFLQPTGSGASELYFIGTNIFDNFHDPVFDYTVAATIHSLSLSDVHFENNPNIHTHYIEGAVNVTVTGGLLEDDNSTGTSDWMIKTNNFTLVNITGTQLVANRPLTCVVDMSNEVRAHIQMIVLTSTNVPALAAGAQVAEATVMPLTLYNATPKAWNIRPPVTFQDLIKLVGVPVYANNAAAITGGLVVGNLYRTNGNPDPICIVH